MTRRLLFQSVSRSFHNQLDKPQPYNKIISENRHSSRVFLLVFNLAMYTIEGRKISIITYSVDKSISPLILSQI